MTSYKYYIFNRVTEIVAEEYQIRPENLFKKRRKHVECRARGVIVYILRYIYMANWITIADYFDATIQTVYKLCSKVEDLEMQEKAGEMRWLLKTLAEKCKNIENKETDDALEKIRKKLLKDKRADNFYNRLDVLLKHREKVKAVLTNKIMTIKELCEVINVSQGTLYKKILGNRNERN